VTPAPKRQRRRQLTRGEDNIAWIETYCRVPAGKFIGQNVRLRPFQNQIIRGIYDQPTRRAIVSFGRKNAKTSLAAMLLLLHLCGLEARANSELYSAAQSRDQAAVLFELAAKMVRLNPRLEEIVGIRDTAKQLYCRELGTVYRALSAEASTAFGLSPSLVIHDELGQVKGPRSPLYEALETATGAQENPLSIVISTQAPTDADLLSILIDDAVAENDPKVRLFLYTSDPEADPFALKTIKQANPAFGDFQNADEVMAMAEDARRMPSREAEYRNLVLNQRVEKANPFITKSVWQGCGGPVIDTFKGLPVYGGLDLSATNDLTALVLIAPHEGRWHVKPKFWLPSEGLPERARRDRVPYDVWHKQGYLEVTPGKSVDYEFVAEHLRGVFDEFDIRQIGFDRWAWVHFRKWLLNAGFDEQELEQKFVPYGQGYMGMTASLRDLESDILNNKLAHGMHPVLTMCAANAVVTLDAAANRKLDKSKSRGRIDGLVSLVMARGVASTEALEQPPSYQMFVLK
jgi:phage terminase large subunit-like protein